MEDKEDEKTVVVLSKIGEDLNRKIRMYQGKYGISKKEEAIPKIMEEYFKDRDIEYKLE